DARQQPIGNHNVAVDDSYTSVRRTLREVWPLALALQLDSDKNSLLPVKHNAPIHRMQRVTVRRRDEYFKAYTVEVAANPAADEQQRDCRPEDRPRDSQLAESPRRPHHACHCFKVRHRLSHMVSYFGRLK